MSKTRKDAPPLVLRRTERGLEARSRLAADELGKFALHSDVEVSIKKKRSLPQLRMFWAMLHNVVEATGAYPTAEHLLDAMKVEMGYTTPMRLLSGDVVFVPDSIALSRMDSAQFRAFFDKAVELLARTYGFDPLAETEKEAA